MKKTEQPNIKRRDMQIIVFYALFSNVLSIVQWFIMCWHKKKKILAQNREVHIQKLRKKIFSWLRDMYSLHTSFNFSFLNIGTNDGTQKRAYLSWTRPKTANFFLGRFRLLSGRMLPCSRSNNRIQYESNIWLKIKS